MEPVQTQSPEQLPRLGAAEGQTTQLPQLQREKSGSQDSLIRAALLTPPSSPNDAVYELSPCPSLALSQLQLAGGPVSPLTPALDDLSENCRRFSIANLLS